MTVLKDHIEATDRHFQPWLRRLGWVGLLFFLIKGLVWLIVPGLIIWLGL